MKDRARRPDAPDAAAQRATQPPAPTLPVHAAALELQQTAGNAAANSVAATANEQLPALAPEALADRLALLEAFGPLIELRPVPNRSGVYGTMLREQSVEIGQQQLKQSAEAVPAQRQSRPMRVQSSEPAGAEALARLHASAGNGAVSRLLRGEVEARDRLETIRSELQRPGEPLDPQTHTQMQSELGRELPAVRVHHGAAAARAANATAFTHGAQIVLGAATPSLASSDGRRLLAHELVHVIQQSQSRPTSLGLVPPDAHAEQQAQAGTAPAAPAAAGGVARIVEKDVSQLSEADLLSEHQLAQHYLSDQPPGADHDAGVAYVLEIEQQIASRAGATAPPPAGGPAAATAAPVAGAPVPKLTSGGGRPPAPQASAPAAEPQPSIAAPAGENELVRRLNEAWAARQRSAAVGGLGGAGVQGGAFGERARAQATRKDWLALSGPTETDLVELSEQLIRAFQQKAYEIALAQLATNEAIARTEAGRYVEASSGDPRTQANRLRGAAVEIGSVQSELLAHIAWVSGRLGRQPYVTATNLDDYLDAPILQYPAFQALRLRYETLRRIYGAEFPILLHKGTDDLAIGMSEPAQLAQHVRGTTGDILDKIGKTRARLARSPELTWSLTPIFELTKRAMGIQSSSYALYVIEQYKAGQDQEKELVNMALAALSLTLAAAGIGVTLASGSVAAPVGAAAIGTAEALGSITLATAGLSVFGAIVQYEDYEFKHSAAGASLDPAKALSADDPSLFWLAVALFAVIVDAGAAVIAFRNLAAVPRAAKTTQELSALQDAARAQASVLKQHGKLKTTEEEFVNRVMEAAHQKLAKQGPSAKVGSALDEELDTIQKADQAARKPKLAIVRGREVAPHSYAGGFHFPGEQTPPEVAFKDGLPARGTDMRLQQHAMPRSEDPMPGPGSAFRGTTPLPSSHPDVRQGAAYWAEEGDWIYEIDGVPTWSVEKALEGQVQLPDGSFTKLITMPEAESAILARVPPERIVRAGKVAVVGQRHFVPEWVPNPNYKPR